MATLYKEQDAWVIQFADGNGKRPKVWLGKIRKQAAETILSHVEEIISARLAGRSVSPETSGWLGKLAKAGLATFQRHTLGELWDTLVILPKLQRIVTSKFWSRIMNMPPSGKAKRCAQAHHFSSRKFQWCAFRCSKRPNRLARSYRKMKKARNLRALTNRCKLLQLPYCRKEDSNLHLKLLRLGPEPSASASSAISASGTILTPPSHFDKRDVPMLIHRAAITVC